MTLLHRIVRPLAIPLSALVLSAVLGLSCQGSRTVARPVTGPVSAACPAIPAAAPLADLPQSASTPLFKSHGKEHAPMHDLPSLDAIRLFALENGLTVALLPRRSAPVVALQVWVGVGSAFESDEDAGMAHLIEHMMFKGSKDFPPGEMTSQIEGIGGDVNAWTSFENTVYHITMSSRFAARGLSILADTLQRPAFDDKELASELKVVLQEISRGKDDPGQLADEELFALAFPGHPYGRPVIGFEKTVANFTSERVRSFYNRFYRPERTVLTITGDFDPDEFEKLVLADWKQWRPEGAAGPSAIPALPLNVHRKKVTVKVLKEPVQEPRLHLSLPMAGLADPLLPAMEILGVVLAQSEGSRLAINVRRRQNLINDESAGPFAGSSVGAFMVEVSLIGGEEASGVKAVFAELQRLARSGVTQGELEAAKRIIHSETLYHWETTQSIGSRLGHSLAYTGTPDFEQRFLDRILSLNVDAVSEAARIMLAERPLQAVLLLSEDDPKPLSGTDVQHLHAEAISAVADESSRQLRDLGHNIVAATLHNGIRVFIRPLPDRPVVAVRAGVLAGVRAETAVNNGINNLIARLLTLGGQRLSGEEYSRRLDALGATVEGFSGYNSLGLKGNFTAATLPEGLELFADALFNASFPEEELQREKEQVLESIRTRSDSPSRVAFDLFRERLFASHPYRFTTEGVEESVTGLDRSDLVEYAQRYLSPDRMVVTVSGAVNPQALLGLLERLMGDVPAFPAHIVPPKAPVAPTQEILVRQDLPKRQTHIVLGFLGPVFTASDRAAAMVLNAILGSQSGRIFTALRDDLGLAYSLGTVMMEGIEPGMFAFYIGSDPTRSEEALDGLRRQVALAAAHKPSKQEVEKAVQYLVGQNDVGLQGTGAQAMSMLLDVLYFDDPTLTFTRSQELYSVTPAAVLKAATHYLSAHPPVVVIVEPSGERPGTSAVSVRTP